MIKYQQDFIHRNFGSNRSRSLIHHETPQAAKAPQVEELPQAEDLPQAEELPQVPHPISPDDEHPPMDVDVDDLPPPRNLAELLKRKKKQKTKEDINTETHTIRSEGVPFTIEGVPKSHELIIRSELSQLRGLAEKQQKLQALFNRERFPVVSNATKTTLATALAGAPSIPLSTLASVLPVIVGAFLNEAGCMPTDTKKFCTALPSEAYMRNLVFQKAAECTLSFKEELQGKQVFLACDKGKAVDC